MAEGVPQWLLVGLAACTWAAVLMIFSTSLDVGYTKPLSVVMGALATALAAFDRWGWRWPGVRSLHGRPLLAGTYHGEIRSDWKDPTTGVQIAPITAVVVVEQTFTNLSVSLFTAESSSTPIAASLLSGVGGRQTVVGLYRNEPRLLLQDRSRVHCGGLKLDIGGKTESRLHGSYWTDRGTTGELDFKFVHKNRAQDFESAQSLIRSKLEQSPETANQLKAYPMSSIFLSHSSQDKFFVRKLAERLRDAGVRVWLDEAEINVGDSLTAKIGEAISDTEFVGAVLSTASIASVWVQRELQIALQKEIGGRQVVVLPILLEPVEVPPFLKDKLYADFTTPEAFDDGFRKLLAALGVANDKLPALQPPVESVPEPRPVRSGAQSRLEEFVDLTIVALDEERSNKPDAGMALYNLYLKLSGAPPHEWQQIFAAERQFPRHSMWRRAWIEGQYIVVYCVPDELERYHLQDLRSDVASTNSKHRSYLAEQVQAENRQAEAARRETDGLSALRRKLGL